MIVGALKKRKNRGRPVLLLDLGVPRNIESAAGALDQVFLHNIDDLGKVAEGNRRKLELEVKRAETIIAEALDEYERHCRGAAAGSTIGELRTTARRIADLEMERTLRKLPDLTDREKEEIGELVHRILGKLLHEPTQNLRLSLHQDQGKEAISWTRRLFGLDAPARKK
jgi:glutamyl-tRNA reductase